MTDYRLNRFVTLSLLVLSLTWRLAASEQHQEETVKIGKNLRILTFEDVDALMKEKPSGSRQEQLEAVRDWYLELAPFKASKSKPIEKFIKLLEVEESKPNYCNQENNRILSNLEFGQRESIWELAMADEAALQASPSKRLIRDFVRDYNAACAKLALADYTKGIAKITDRVLEKVRQFEKTVEERKSQVEDSPAYERNTLSVLRRESENLRDELRFDRKLKESCTDFVDELTPVYLPGFSYSLDLSRNLDAKIVADEGSFYACKALIDESQLF